MIKLGSLCADLLIAFYMVYVTSTLAFHKQFSGYFGGKGLETLASTGRKCCCECMRFGSMIQFTAKEYGNISVQMYGD